MPSALGLVYTTVGSGIMLMSVDVAVMVMVWSSLAAPVAMPLKLMVCSPASSRIASGSVMSAIVGTSFTAVTATSKETITVSMPPLSVLPSSSTRTVTTAVP